MSQPYVKIGPESRMIINSEIIPIVSANIRVVGDVPEKSDSENYPYKKHARQGLRILNLTAQIQYESNVYDGGNNVTESNLLYTHLIFPSNQVEWFFLPNWSAATLDSYYAPNLVISAQPHSYNVAGSAPQMFNLTGQTNGRFALPQDPYHRCIPKGTAGFGLYSAYLAQVKNLGFAAFTNATECGAQTPADVCLNSKSPGDVNNS